MKIFILCLISLSFGCATTRPQNGSEVAKVSNAAPKSNILTHEESFLRAKQISRPTYGLWFGLDGLNEDYNGRVVITFEVRPKGKDLSKTLFLDFESGTIRTLTLNGTPIAQPQFDGQRIALKMSELLTGHNRIEIAFNHPYSKDGNGLYRFKDPVDGKVYLYSNFEPYSAHKMFPCFDQPDLKGSYELTVEAPSDWEVISNTLEREATSIDGRKSWSFPPSPVFSTYVFALHAGPYAVWKSTAAGIPLRLFARKSLAQYVDAPEWFDITTKGLEYYAIQFGYPYPYSKYDQIIVPDFNAGAMENVAAVTFTERTIYRTKVTQDQHRRRADTILHEMAHMWFGDLVTMRWWNGLWLNESFATYMSSRALTEATSYPGVWQSFFGTKLWAYWEDQLVTTHPIEVAIPDTDGAKANFDGIVYGKGAASLKQLNYYLGDDDFKEGVQRYFQKYALKNTTLSEFFRMLSEASGKDLSAWHKMWIQTSGTNTLQAQWGCEDGKINRFALVQDNSEGSNLLRPHRTQIALYRFNKQGKGLHVADTTEVTYSQANTPIPALIGKACPLLVFPNDQDHDYVKVELDPESIEAAKKYLGQIDDSFARQMIWSSLWQMVIDTKLKAQTFGELVTKFSARETNTQILSVLLDRLISPSPKRASVFKFLPPDERAPFREKLESFLRKNLLASAAGSDLQLVWFNAFIDAASVPSSLQYLQGLLSDKVKIKGIKMDQEQRWEAIGALARNDSEGIRDKIAEELKKDSTDNGKRSALSAEASMPLESSKREWLAKILKPILGNQPEDAELNPSKLRSVMSNFHQAGHEDLIQLSVESYFETLPKLTDSSKMEYTLSFTNSMYPALCDPEIIKKVTGILAQNPDLPAGIVKSLKISRQEDERCIRARAMAAAP